MLSQRRIALQGAGSGAHAFALQGFAAVAGSINPVAVQGVGFGPHLMALQGFGTPLAIEQALLGGVPRITWARHKRISRLQSIAEEIREANPVQVIALAADFKELFLEELRQAKRDAAIAAREIAVREQAALLNLMSTAEPEVQVDPLVLTKFLDDDELAVLSAAVLTLTRH